MSNSVQTSALLAALNTALQAAAQTFLPSSQPNPIRIFNEPPRTKQALPYVIAEPSVVRISLRGRAAGVQNPSQENSFKITVRQTFPSNPATKVLPLKVATANAIIAELQQGPTFAGIAGFPLVTHVDYSESDRFQEPAFEVTIRFECVTTAAHH